MGAKLLRSNQDEDQINKMAEIIADKERVKYGEIDRFFREYDFNGDNLLDESEFKAAIKAYIKVHPEKETNLAELMLHLDMGPDSLLTLESFRSVMTVYLSDEISIEFMIDVFKCFDKNLQGLIGCNEIRHVFSKLGLNLTLDEAKELVKEADLDGDDLIDFEEFLKIMIAK